MEDAMRKDKDTKDLQEELMSSPNLSRFLSENQENFNSMGFSELLQKLFWRKNISKSALAKSSGMSEVYLYQLFSGGRNPSRNRILCLCFGLSASLEESQEMLRSCGKALLYAKDRRDAIIIFGLVHEMTLEEVNDQLFSEGEKTLF